MDGGAWWATVHGVTKSRTWLSNFTQHWPLLIYLSPVLLPRKSHGRRSLVGYSPWGRKESDMTEQLHSTPKKYILFINRGLECNSKKSRDTWSNRQIWPWTTKWSRAKDNRFLPRECTGHSKQPLPTTQEKTLHMDITRWSTLKSDCLYSLQPKMEKLYTVSKNKTRSWLWRSWTPYCQIQTEIEESVENH